MTNAEAVRRWAEFIIPAVFKAEDALQKTVPEWKERLRNIPEDKASEIAAEYCTAIATIIVTQGSDYEPDGTLPGDDIEEKENMDYE